jgi:hypothetical protein
MQGIGDILNLLRAALPPWALALLAAALVVGFGPAWFDTVRIKQIKGCVRQMQRAPPSEHPAWVDEAFRRARGRPARLSALVREAHRVGFRDMAEEGLRRLRDGGRSPDDVRALDKLLHPPPDVPATALEASVRVEQLLDAGLLVGAAEQLRSARSRFPDDAELRALEARLSREAAG